MPGRRVECLERAGGGREEQPSVIRRDESPATRSVDEFLPGDLACGSIDRDHPRADRTCREDDHETIRDDRIGYRALKIDRPFHLERRRERLAEGDDAVMRGIDLEGR